MATTAAHISASERGDTPAAVGLFVATGQLTLTEPRDHPALAAGFRPIQAAMAHTERGDGPAIHGANSAHYEVYSNGGTGGPINYSAPIALTTNTSWITPPLTPGTWSFAIRAANPNGLEENLDCITTIIIDAHGNDATNLPAPPVGLTVLPAAAAQLAAHWTYPPTNLAGPKAPTGFHVYVGAPTPNYAAPAAQIAAGTAVQGIYWTTLTGLVDATKYAVAVRAFNNSGEEANTTIVTATANGTGPVPVANLTATAIV